MIAVLILMTLLCALFAGMAYFADRLVAPSLERRSQDCSGKQSTRPECAGEGGRSEIFDPHRMGVWS